MNSSGNTHLTQVVRAVNAILNMMPEVSYWRAVVTKRISSITLTVDGWSYRWNNEIRVVHTFLYALHVKIVRLKDV